MVDGSWGMSSVPRTHFAGFGEHSCHTHWMVTARQRLLEPLCRAMCSDRVLGVFRALNRHLHIQTARAVWKYVFSLIRILDRIRQEACCKDKGKLPWQICLSGCSCCRGQPAPGSLLNGASFLRHDSLVYLMSLHVNQILPKWGFDTALTFLSVGWGWGRNPLFLCMRRKTFPGPDAVIWPSKVGGSLGKSTCGPQSRVCVSFPSSLGDNAWLQLCYSFYTLCPLSSKVNM